MELLSLILTSIGVVKMVEKVSDELERKNFQNTRQRNAEREYRAKFLGFFDPDSFETFDIFRIPFRNDCWYVP